MIEKEIRRFPPIQRGTSLKIPIIIKKLDESPFNLTGYRLKLTLKPVLYDYDYQDQRAFIQVFAQNVDLPNGRVDFLLKSKQTWLPPGEYFFDVELISAGQSVTRLCTMKTEIVGGPTNNTIGSETDTAQFYADGLHFTFTDSIPIVFVAPLLSQTPVHLVENFKAFPNYIWNNNLESPEIDVRSARLTFTNSFTTELDATPGAPSRAMFSSSFVEPTYPIYNLGVEMVGSVVKMINLPSNYRYELYHTQNNTYKNGTTADVVQTNLELNSINNIKVILQDITSDSKIYLDFVCYCPGAMGATTINWNVKIDWIYC